MITDFKNNLIQLEQKLSFPFNLHLKRDIPLDEFFRNFYVEPKIVKTGFTATPVFDWMPGNPHRAVVIGLMGAGKSTYLTSQFLKAQRNGRFVLFRDFRFFIENEVILDQYISEKVSATIFVDSLDETVPEEMGEHFGRILDKLLNLENVLIACRSPFFKDLFGERRQTLLDFQIQIEPYGPDEQNQIISKFVAALSEGPRLHEEESLAKDLAKQYRDKAKVGEHLSATPLVSAFCALAGVNGESLHRLQSVATLYRYIANLIAKQVLQDEYSGITALGNMAWEIETRQRRRSSWLVIPP